MFSFVAVHQCNAIVLYVADITARNIGWMKASLIVIGTKRTSVGFCRWSRFVACRVGTGSVYTGNALGGEKSPHTNI